MISDFPLPRCFSFIVAIQQILPPPPQPQRTLRNQNGEPKGNLTLLLELRVVSIHKIVYKTEGKCVATTRPANSYHRWCFSFRPNCVCVHMCFAHVLMSLTSLIKTHTIQQQGRSGLILSVIFRSRRLFI